MASKYKSGSDTGARAAEKEKNREKLRKYAERYAKRAIDQLATQMETAPEKAVRVSAAREILDRAIGRPTAIVGGDSSAPIVVKLEGSDKDL